MPIENKTYTCQHCGANLRTYDICKEHEEWCKIEREEKTVYQSRLIKLFPNQYMFYAQSEEDVDRCIDYNGLGASSNYDYEEYTYPCLVLMFTSKEIDVYEDYEEKYTDIIAYNKYLRKLESMKGECK